MRLSRVWASVLISLITGQARWGNFLYAANSTILGSIKTKRISLAVFLQTSPAIRLLIKTLLPDPVVPAIKRGGICTRSSTTGSPRVSTPRATGRIISDERYFGLLRDRKSVV